jgi:sialate O-acetylesterase
MKRLLVSLPLTLLAALAILTPRAAADVKLPTVLASHMVVQRDKPLSIWGWADPGEEVNVTFAGKSASAKADDKGNWKVTLPAFAADGGKAHELVVSGKNKLTLEDVLIGEVWVGSGQSNMEWNVASSTGGKEAIDAANHPKIRLYLVPKVQAKEPQKDIKAEWKVCSPKTLAPNSGVLYFFGLKLQKELDVPVGLISSSWGGSPIQPWTIDQKSSGGMYNAMIAPIASFPVRGVIWYQGESNMGEGLKYRDRMEALIAGWRKHWGEDMPFYFVQIAPFAGYRAPLLPLWEAQAASMKIPHTGMVVVTDLVDNVKDIHPKNKKDVGDRLAFWALAKDYGKKDVAYSGPLFKSAEVKGDKLVLSFAHGEGLKSRDGKPLSDFEIAGEDGKFVPAEAKIEGDKVVVSASGVDKPTQARFGGTNTTNPNLVNKAGLPASPFQTKGWTGGTGE